MTSRYESDDPGHDADRDRSNEFQRAVSRLEKAVQDLVGNANESLSSRATRFVDEAADRLEREASRRSRRRGADDDAHREGDDEASARYERSSRRSRRRRHRMHRSGLSTRDPGYRTSRLYRDTHRQKIAGVCAGLARYFGVEIWVVRCLALTGLIFMSSIVIPAYIIAWIVLPAAPNGEVPAAEGKSVDDHTALAPELGARLSPRHSLRNVQSELDQIELKLRRMESHVTSGQYELQRELRKIDT